MYIFGTCWINQRIHIWLEKLLNERLSVFRCYFFIKQTWYTMSRQYEIMFFIVKWRGARWILEIHPQLIPLSAVGSASIKFQVHKLWKVDLWEIIPSWTCLVLRHEETDYYNEEASINCKFQIEWASVKFLYEIECS